MAPFACHKCGTPWESDKRQPGFKENCVKCGAYLHSCKNCRFHRTSAPNQCEVPGTEALGDRSGLNFCEEFEFRTHSPVAADPEKQRAAREALARLFKEDDGAPPAPSFEDLFRK